MKKSCGVHALRIAVGITMLVLLLAGSAGAMTITVNASGSGDYTMIQDAIDNASAGDMILVYSGTYYENVNVTKQLILRGIGNPMVDAGGSGSAITLSANGITLEGFTATRGSSYPEAGIKVTSSSNMLNGNNASSNKYCGIFLSFSNNNTLNGSNASNNDIGIFLSSSGNNTISGNNASNNSYSGIYLSSSSNNKLGGNNASSNNNHGIYLSSSRNNTLIRNNASLNNNIGILMRLSSKNTLSGNMMTGNQYNFDSDGGTDSDFDNHIDTSNLVEGRSIYYIINVSDTTYDSSNAGTLYCISCVNVTIKNLNLNKNGKGIYFWNTSQSRIKNVNASNNRVGIYLENSSNNTLSDNHALNNGIGIYLEYSSNNTLSDNNASLNNWNGIVLGYSSNNIMGGNNVSNNDDGIALGYSSNNTLIGNNATSNNWNGIYLYSSSKNTLSGNMMTENQENFYLDGHTDSDFDNHIDTGNLVNGRPIYYIINVSDTTYDSSNAGTLYCISCINVTIKNLNLNKNGKGIYFWNTSQSRIQNVNASNNGIGIYLDYSSNNTLSDNNASSNNWNGIVLGYSSNNTLSGNNASSNNNLGIFLLSSSKNTIYNNIFNNTNNFYFYDSNINTWNTTRQPGTNIIGGFLLGGNFWANPNGTGFSQTCKDVNGDGICDSSRTLDANNIDYLPIMKYKIPPKSVSKLKNVSYASAYINWTWTDPEDVGFDKVKIYINNIYRTSVMKGVQYYKAKNLYANRSYTISTRTVDKSGNLNLTWKNNTARTKPDLVPPMNVTNLKNKTYGKNYINWTWKDPKDTDFKKVMVFIDGNFKENVSKGKWYYNATDFSANTKHTISTWTVDRNGNINKTWTNHSAWTAK